MNETLLDLASYRVPAAYDDPLFHNVLQDHIEYLNNRSDTRQVLIEAHIADKYRFDLFGLLEHYNVPDSSKWITMRMNGFLNPQAYDGRNGYVLIPEQSEIEKIFQTHNTQVKKIF